MRSINDAPASEKTQEKSSNDAPPDGGSAAWIAVSPSEISWIGSTQVCLLFFTGTPAGWLSDIGYFRHVLATGSVLQVLGIFCAAQATKYWQVLISQGICVGLGNGLVFCPTLAVVSTYFDRRKSLAIGIGMAGSSTGGLIFPSMVRQLLPQIGFSWTMRSIGFLQLATLCIVNALMRTRIPPAKAKRVVDREAFKDPVYSFYAASMFFNLLGVYFAFYYIASFAHSNLPDTFTYEKSLDLLLILNGVGLVGRIVPNYLADRYTGAINMLLPMSTLCGILCLSWTAVGSASGMYAWTCIYAIAAAAVQSMTPAALAGLTENLQLVGIRAYRIYSAVALTFYSATAYRRLTSFAKAHLRLYFASKIMSLYNQLVLFGDSMFEFSIDAQNGYSFHAALQALVVRRLDVINRGFAGYTTRNALELLPKIIPPPSPSTPRIEYLAILFGPNDVILPLPTTSQHIPVEEYQDNLRKIVTHPNITAHNPKIFLVAPPPLNEIKTAQSDLAKGHPQAIREAAVAQKYSEAVRKVAQAVPEVILIDLFKAITDAANAATLDFNSNEPPLGHPGGRAGALETLIPDGLHLGGEGYKVLYDLLQPHIGPLSDTEEGWVFPDWRILNPGDNLS
ncbi:hypothetical protein FSARC_7748 [Fusarium sarcochroum]|uniref:SGNH hydrolase-type esterase domain-containing protein n=1 Tax=Fusarium sarcochroum TaxID=1208366 RepID=A0A8H4TUC0_9HYPO|nr:hypothetical protein FSARC_7748 [Fusarium sarcochroum]